MTDEQRNQPGMPAFRHVGTGSLVTKHCLRCDRWKLTTGSSGSGIRWRCAACKKPKVKETA